MPTRRQALELLKAGVDYQQAADLLRVPPGRLYLIAMGIAADGSGALTAAQASRPGVLRSHTQKLVNPRVVRPADRRDVLQWVRWRTYTDLPLRAASGR